MRYISCVIHCYRKPVSRVMQNFKRLQHFMASNIICCMCWNNAINAQSMLQNKRQYFVCTNPVLFWFWGFGFFFFFAMNAKLDELHAKIQFYLYEASSWICTEFFNCFSYPPKYSEQELRYLAITEHTEGLSTLLRSGRLHFLLNRSRVQKYSIQQVRIRFDVQ